MFCENCLGGMSDYPIKPDAKVSLPHRDAPTAPKKHVPRKRVQPPEEQLEALHKLARRLIVALITVTVLFCLSAAALIHNYRGEANQLPAIGRNYTIDPTQGP